MTAAPNFAMPEDKKTRPLPVMPEGRETRSDSDYVSHLSGISRIERTVDPYRHARSLLSGRAHQFHAPAQQNAAVTVEGPAAVTVESTAGVTVRVTAAVRPIP